MCSLTWEGGQPQLGVVTVFNPEDQIHACDPKDPALQSRKSAQEAPPIPLALQEACLRIGYCHTSHWLSPGVWPGLRFWGHVRERDVRERDVWVPGFPKGRRIRLMPLGQGSLGYQAREGRGQGPARSSLKQTPLSCPLALEASIIKGGPSHFLDLFTLRHS